MKKAFFIILMAFSLVACNNDIYKAIEDLNNKIEELDGRVSQLEELCKEMNTNISSLQTIVNVILTNDYIISIAPVTKDGEEIGYVITFAQHEPITIYHGQKGKDGNDGKDGENGKDGKDGLNGEDGKDGKDGIDGEDGQDGVSPIVSVKLDSIDGAYYWTIDGQWLYNENNERVPVTSKNGKDGHDGQNGQDGITPQLKIENGYWYISYNQGVSWTMLYKAVGEDGQDGQDGQDGDSMFSSVTQDDDFVYFTLVNGTVLKVPLAKDEDGDVKIINGAIMAEYSISQTRKVYFSMGDLEFSTEGTHLCADGSTQMGIWRFATDQIASSSDDNWSNRFEWGSSGCNLSYPHTDTLKMSGAYSYLDWGIYNAISNGGNQPNQWRTLTPAEWDYILYRDGGTKWLAVRLPTDDNKRYIVLFPDSFDVPFLTNHDEYKIGYSDVEVMYTPISAEKLQKWISCGAVLLYVSFSSSSSSSLYANYWANQYIKGVVYSYYSSNFQDRFGNSVWYFRNERVYCGTSTNASATAKVRLVKDAQ